MARWIYIALTLLGFAAATTAQQRDATIWWGEITSQAPINEKFELELYTNRFGRAAGELRMGGVSDKSARLFNVRSFPKGIEFQHRPERDMSTWTDWRIEWLPGGETAEGWLSIDGERSSVVLRKGRLGEGKLAKHSVDGGAGFDESTEHWAGTLALPNGNIPFSVTLESDGDDRDGDWSGRLWIPLQNVVGQKLSKVEVDDESVVFEFQQALRWELTRTDPDSPSASGRFLQGSIDASFNASRLNDRDALKSRVLIRPQEPKEPFSYRVEDFEIDSSDGETIAGTLTLPNAASFSGPYPVAVLLSGSGAQDRDSSIAGHKPFLLIADRLAEVGVASVRFADRGMDGSTGSFRQLTTRDIADDARDVLGWARSHTATDASRAGVIGHSEGGIVASLLAADNPNVSWAVLLATPGVPGEQLLPKQMEALFTLLGADAQTVLALNATMQVYYDRLLAGDSQAQSTAAATEYMNENDIEGDMRMGIGGQLIGFAQLYGEEWTREFLSLDPTDSMARMNQPTLVVQGDLDAQVLAEQNVRPIEAALKRGGADVTVRRVPGLNHLLQPATTGSITEYQLVETTIAESVLEVLAEWVKENTSGAGGTRSEQPPAPRIGGA